MQNRTTQELFDLIKGMNKWEKKCFNHYTRRSTSSETPGVLRLFRILDGLEQYDDKAFTRKAKGLQYRQLPALKAKLYQQLLDSLRTGRKAENGLVQLHHQMDHVHILYEKGFYVQAGKVLRRLVNGARAFHQVPLLFQALVLQRKIKGVQGQSTQQEIRQLNNDINECQRQLALIARLSNQSQLLYGWYQRCGVLRNQKEEADANALFQTCLPAADEGLTFYPRLYFLQAKTYYYLLRGQPALCHEAAREWVAHFERHPQLKDIELVQYGRGLMYLNEAAFLHRHEKDMYHTAARLEEGKDACYHLCARLNLRLWEQRPDRRLLEEACQFVQNLHNSSRLYQVCTKAVLLCFAGKEWERALDFTLVALNRKADARLDLQYQLRCFHLQAHAKMHNHELTEYLAVSLRRFANTHHLPVNTLGNAHFGGEEWKKLLEQLSAGSL